MNFTAACAPSRDAFKSRASDAAFRAHAVGVADLLADGGVGVFTESKRRSEILFDVFGHSSVLMTGQPIVAVGGTVLAKGIREGHAAIKGVCGPRNISWMVWSFGGRKVGVIGVHPTPGHPAQRSKNPVHRLRRKVIAKRYRRYRLRARMLFRWLRDAQRCDVIVIAGDINRPGDFAYIPAARRVSAQGLVYLAVWGAGNGPVGRKSFKGADHKTTWTKVRK